MGMQWVTVYWGSPGRSLLAQNALEAAGIPTFLPDDAMRHADPFLVGPMGLQTIVQVPAPERDAALEILADFQHDSPPADPARVEIERLARRLVLGCLFVGMLPLLLPWVLLNAWMYFGAVARSQTRPPGHGVTIAFCILGAAQASLGIWTWSGLLR